MAKTWKNGEAMWRKFRLEEKAVREDFAMIRQAIDDGHDVCRELRDAIKLPPETVALPNLRKRFNVLVCDLLAQMGPLYRD